MPGSRPPARRRPAFVEPSGPTRKAGTPAVSVSRPAARPNAVLYAAAGLSLVAALVHLWVTPEHLEEWWGFGAFFLVCAAAQALYAQLLLRRPNQAILLLGVAGNLAVVILWLVTRTTGIPLFGPHAGEVEEAGRGCQSGYMAPAVLGIGPGVPLVALIRARPSKLSCALCNTISVPSGDQEGWPSPRSGVAVSPTGVPTFRERLFWVLRE
jgi:hypothetical protein